MSGILFEEIIFGPIRSRRFGISLGINLLPLDSKLCSFDCIYCECGLTGHTQGVKPALYGKEQILEALESRLKAMNQVPDSITFAGNGEPTMHPRFAEIMDGVVALRNTWCPEAKITVLSNATMLSRDHVREALLKADNNVLKLDAGSDAMFQLINRPLQPIRLEEVVERLIAFKGDLIIQTLFLRGEIEGKRVDNTLDTEVDLWLGHLQQIRPRLVMLYPVDRATPFPGLEKAGSEELRAIAARVEQLGIAAEVY